MHIEDWFLTADERGNSASDLLTSCAGNEVRALVNGAAYCQVLLGQRVRRAGSKHQKIVVLRRPGRPGPRRGVRRRHRPVALPA